MKKYLFVFILTISIIFNTFMPNIVHANPLVTTATAELVASAGALSVALPPFAPEIALVTCIAIGAGVVFENREQIITMAGGLYNDLISAGYHILRTEGALALDSAGVNYLANRILEISSSGKQNIPLNNIPITGTILPIMGLMGMTLSGGTKINLRNISDNSIWMTETFLVATTLSYAPSTSLSAQDRLDYWAMIYTTVASGIWQPYSFRKDGARVAELIPGTNDESICIDAKYPTQVFEGDITTTAGGTSTTVPRGISQPYLPEGAVSIPSTLPLTGDWTGNLVGTSDWETTFPLADSIPIDVPIDTTGTGITVPLDYGVPLSVPLDFSPLMNFDLTTKFPFSIPWDIKKSVETLVAPSQAPTFDIDMTRWVGGTHYIIDFSMFDKLALIMRWGLLMIFNIGLMLKTRSIIRG